MHVYMFSYHQIEAVRKYAAGDGHSLLLPEVTTFLNHREAYSRPEDVTVACGRRPQGFMSQKSRLNPEQIVTLTDR